MKNDFERKDTAAEQVYDLMPDKKRKLGADVILLIFICLLVLLSLTTLTFLKFGSEQVLTGEMALAVEEQSETTRFSAGAGSNAVSDTIFYADEETPGFTEYDADEFEDENFFYDNVVCYNVNFDYNEETGMVEADYFDHDEEGNIIVNSVGDPVIVHYSEYWAPGSMVGVKFDMDKALGLKESDTEEEALQKFINADNAALAATWGPSTYNQYAPNSSYNCASNLSASSSSSGGNGSGCDCYCNNYVELTGAQWRRWCNSWVCYAYATWNEGGSGSSGYYRAVKVGWMSSASYRNDNNERYYSSWRNGASSPYRFFVCMHGHSNSTGSCSGSSVSASFSGCYMYVQHTNGRNLTWTTTPSTSQGWATYRAANQITWTAYSNPDFVRRFWVQWSRSESSWGSVQTVGATGSSYNTSSVTLRNSNECYSNAYAYADDQAGGAISGGVSGAQLHIDRYAPTGAGFYMTVTTNVASQYLVQTSSSQSAAVNNGASNKTASKTTTLYIFTYVNDFEVWNYSYNGYSGYGSGASGISGGNSRVWAYNSQNGVTVELSADQGANGSYRWRRGSVQAQYANGLWYVYAKDYVGNQRTIVNGYWINAVDCDAPHYDSGNSDGKFQVLPDNTKSNAGNYWTTDSSAWTGSIRWSSAPLFCRMRFYDQTGCNVTNGNVYKRNGINYAVITFFYNGATYKMTANVTASGGNTNLTNVVGLSDRGEGGWNTATKYSWVYFYLPYDMRNIWTASDKKTNGFNIVVYDYAGHSVSTNINDQTYKIDTVAPKVTGVSVNVGKNSGAYTNANPVVTVTAQDYTNTSSQISGITYCNNGSGLRCVYVYNVNPRSNRSATPLTTLTTNTSGQKLAATAAGSGAAHSFTYTVTMDARNISGSNGSDPYLYFVAEDWAGNRSDAYNGYTTNTSLYTQNGSARTHNDQKYKNIQANNASAAIAMSGWNYYFSPDNTTTNGTNCITVWRDTVTPQVRIYTDAACTAANCIASTDGTNSSTTVYAFDWRSISSLTIYATVVIGSSGGTLKLNGGATGITNKSNAAGNTVAHYRTNGESYSSSPAQATYTKFAITISQQGAKSNSIQFTTNSSKSSTSLTITTRMDQSKPVPTLLGFSSSVRNSADALAKAYDNTESNLTNSWTGNAYYAVFKITDTYSGLSNASDHKQYYGKNGNSLQQTTKCNYTITFTYSYTDSASKTHKYTYTRTGILSYIDGAYYAQVLMFQLTDFQNVSNSGTSGSRTFLSGGAWDITPGTYLHYTFKVKDFVGNEATFATKYGQGTKDSSGYTTDLAYLADPFPVSAIIYTYHVSTSDWNSLYSGKTITSKAIGYGGEWTKDYVLIRVSMTPGLSPTTSQFGYKTEGMSSFTYSNVASIGVNATPYSIVANKEEWFYFSPGTRSLTAEIKVASKTKTYSVAGRKPVSPDVIAGDIIIRQDVAAPVVTAAFFSRYSNITTISDANTLMYFDYIGGKFYLNTKKSSRFDQTNGYIWADGKTYLYLVVSDCVNGLNGSGVCQNNFAETGSGAVKAGYRSVTYANDNDNVGTVSTGTDRMKPISNIRSVCEKTGNSYFSTSDTTYQSTKVYYNKKSDGSYVQLNKDVDYKVGEAINNFSYLYRSSNASTPLYGYMSKGDLTTSSVTITDYLGNSLTFNIGGNSAAGTNTVIAETVKAHKMYPLVDGVTPILSLTGTDKINFASADPNASNGGGNYTNASYTKTVGSVQKLYGTDLDTNGNPIKYSAGDRKDEIIKYFTQTETIVLNFNVKVGISGYKLYLRKRDFNTKLASQSGTGKQYTSLSTYVSNGYLPANYNFSNEGWGYYNNNSVWTISGDSQVVSSISDTQTRTPSKGYDTTISIKGSAVTARFDMLLVAGTGKYYLIEMGDVIMDNAAPEFYRYMTFFTNVRDTDDATNKVVDFSKVRNTDTGNLIWSNNVENEYSNGEVNCYFSLTDTGIGIDDSTVKINGTTLTKLSVSNLRVVTIGGKATNIIWFDNLYSKVTTSSTKGAGGNYVVTITKKNNSTITAESNITYGSLSSTTASYTTLTTPVTYYRYLAASSASIQVKAADLLTKAMPSTGTGATPTYVPKIDQNSVTLKVNMTYYQNAKNEVVTDGQTYKGYDATNKEEIFSRTKIDIDVTMTYGVSGFGIFRLTQTDIWDDAVNHPSKNPTATYTTKLPLVSNSAGKVQLGYYDVNGTWTTKVTSFNYAATNVLTVKRQSDNKYYWHVNGENNNTGIIVNETVYAAVVRKNAALHIKLGTVTTVDFVFSLPATNNCKDKYDYYFENAVTIKSTRTQEGHKPATVSADNTKYVYMDTQAPILDTSKGTYNLIANSTSYNRYGKLLSVAIADNFALAKAENAGNLIDKVKITWKVPVYNADGTLNVNKTNNNVFETWMLNDYKVYNASAGDKLYRPTLYLDEEGNNLGVYDASTETIRRNAFLYCDYNVDYVIEAWDKAGNYMKETVTPTIDPVKSEITSFNFYSTYNESNPSLNVAYKPGTWTSGAVTIVGTAKYGSSGFVLQAREKTTDSFASSDWKTLTLGSGYTILSGGADVDGTVTFKIVLAKDASTTAYYDYYEVRILSKAELYEIEHGGTQNVEGTKLSLQRTVMTNRSGVEVATPTMIDKLCLIGDVSKNVDLDGEHEVASYKTDANGKKVKDTAGVRIDKVTPGISLTVTSSSVAYGSASGYVWTADTYYVNDSVLISVTASQTANPSNLSYASGNYFFYTTDLNANVNEWTKWTRIDPNGNRYSYASGSYSNSIGVGADIVISEVRHNVTPEKYATSFVYTISSSVRSDARKFYIMSGAGLRSQVFTVKDIKIDINKPNIEVSAVDSYEEFGLAPDGKYKEVSASNFDNTTTYQTKKYTLTESGSTWSKKNSVILKIVIGGVGYSGAKLYIKEQLKKNSAYVDQTDYVEYCSLSFDEFEARKGADGKVVMYIAINKNGDRIFLMKVYENARKNGSLNMEDQKHSDENKSYVKMDNTTPLVSVSSISAGSNGKAANWAYAASGDKWYVEDVRVTLTAGIVEKSGNNYIYKSDVPYSGFKVYYCQASVVNDNGRTTTSTEWFEVTRTGTSAQRIMTISGLVIKGSYLFKIVSGSGMEFILGEDIHDSSASSKPINTVRYNNKNLNKSDLQTELSMITGHTVDGVDDKSFGYTFNVDTNKYSYSYFAQLCTTWAEDEKNRVYNTTTSDLVDYIVKKGDWTNANGGNFVNVNVNDGTAVYKHGDIIKIDYTSKTNSVTVQQSGQQLTYNYKNYHNYTDVKQVKSDGGTLVTVNTVKHENNGTTLRENGGSFTVIFGRYSLRIVADYGAELTVKYDTTTFYRQYNENDTVTTGSVIYYWTGSNKIAPALSYNYYVLSLDQYGNKVFTDEVPSSVVRGKEHAYDVGAYYVEPYIALYNPFTDYSVGTRVSAAGVTVYERNGSGQYVVTNDNDFVSNKDYFVRNSTGNFRVAVRDGSEKERQEFVVKYFSEDPNVNKVSENIGYYLIENLVDFGYVDKDYYNYNVSTDVLTKVSYLKDTNNRVYKLFNDFTLTKDTFSGFNGKFLARMDGNFHTITLSSLGTLSASYGIFNDFAGTLTNLNLVADETVRVYLMGSGETDVGLLAKTISGGSISNVTVTADYFISAEPGYSGSAYVGGISAKASAVTLGSDDARVYTDIRVKNGGNRLANTYIGGMFGSVTGVTFNNAIAFGDVTVYNVDPSTKVGLVVPTGSVASADGLKYFKNNTFYNDATVGTMGMNFNDTFGRGLTYDSFIAETTDENISVAIGGNLIAGKSVKDRILERLYTDFGFSYANGYLSGYGTTAYPLQVSTVDNLTEIEEYVNLTYEVVSDINVSEFRPIAIHKIFNGTLKTANSTTYYVLSGFGNGIETYSEKYFGFFGQLNGTVSNLVFNGFNIDMTYSGTEALMFGIVAGRAYTGACVNNVFVVGITNVSSATAPLYVGGIVGSAKGTLFYDVVNMNNIKVTSSTIKAGGIVGQSGYSDNVTDDAVKLSPESGTVYSFGRVETIATSEARVDAGAIIGEGDMKSKPQSPTVYGLLDNTYILGVVASEKAIGNGSAKQSAPSMVAFTDDTMRKTQLSNGLSAFNLLFGQNGWYPIEGAGLDSNPFKITSEEDFKNINLALFAYYKLVGDSNNEIHFRDFQTIGEGLNFTGTIDGAGEGVIDAERSNIVSLMNVTKPLVYNIRGTVQNIGINVQYTHTIQENETLYFGVVGVKLEAGGNVKNITVGGSVDITGINDSTTAYVSGFVATVSGGTIDNHLVTDTSKLRNNISALNINVKNVGTVYIGGYAASVEQGGATFSFGISNGTITIEDCPRSKVTAGFLVGQSYGECQWTLSLDSEYFYNIVIINHKAGGTEIENLPKPDDDDDEETKRDKLVGRQN